MPVIQLRDVHKSFRIPHEVHTTLTERILSGFRGTTYERFDALRGIDLTIERGAFIGVIGGNGSGKSTLLKIMSGLLPPDRGEVHVDGSMSALLELGLGFSAELTVRENVELYAAVLGYPRKECKRRVEDAIQFAGLDRFRDAKLKNLSTGMRARLGFATALQAESDILLLDEILAVGDADFQLKCLAVFEQFKLERRTVVLVTHDLGQVQRFCDRAVLVQNGQIKADGNPDEVIPLYLQSVGQLQQALAELDAAQRHGDGAIRCQRAWFEDEHGRPIARAHSGERIVFAAICQIIEDADEPVLGFALKGEDGTIVYSVNTNWHGTATGSVRAGQCVELRASFVVALRNGRYAVQICVADRGLTKFHDAFDRAAAIMIHGSRALDGLTDLHARLDYRVLVEAPVEYEAPVAEADADPDPEGEPSAAAPGVDWMGGRR
jgi:ABC-type polysaccharide/polyol phosphate transport system ATPase subunit